MQLFHGSSQINKAYYGGNEVKQIYYRNEVMWAKKSTLTIQPTPSFATVTFAPIPDSQVSGNSITTYYGTNITYTVAQSGYVTKTESTILLDDIILPVSLMNQYTFTINPTPSNATVVLSAPGTTQVGNSILVNPGDTVSYSVSKTGYVTQSNSIVVNSTQTLPITLILQTYTLTVEPNPTDATVTFSTGTVSGNNCTVNYGTQVTYTVSKANYATQSGTVTVLSNQTIQVQLPYTPYSPNQVIFESATAGTSSLNLLTPGTYNVICVGGGGGGAGRLLVGTVAAGAGGGSGGYSNSNIGINSAGNVSVTVGGAGSSTTSQGGGTSTAGGGGTSSFGSYLSATGGGGGYVKAQNASPTMTGGSAGTGTTSNGNAGGTKKIETSGGYVTANGGASVYGGYGRGASIKIYTGSKPSVASASTSGYVKVTFISY